MEDPTVQRRTLLRTLAGGSATALAGCSALESGPDAGTTELDEERARELALRFAPTVYFDEYERWFPTDPRRFESEAEGDVTVDGFDALNGYTRQYTKSGSPPAPTVFYHVVEYRESPLAVVQFWFYSAFDQFATNFHWHDWEVFHAFVDTESGEPQLYVASSHSRTVPNNEFLDPDPDRVPRILSELGSHSSTLSLNDQFDRFARLPSGDVFADITNSAIKSIESLAELPIAYGLPRDEGSHLPYLVPELDGKPLSEHEQLPAVDQSHLVDEALTIRSFDELISPPTDLPVRDTGLVFQPKDRAEQADIGYELVPTSAVEHISAFTGPQLSFEFAIPKFAEDAVAGHITTTGVPWSQSRYANPAADISDPVHRATLADRYDAIGNPAPANRVVAIVTRAVTTDDAPEDQGLTTVESTVEAAALLESEPRAVPSFRGVTVFQDAPEGEHRLTVNSAGAAPHSETVEVTGKAAVTAAGVEGEIPLVAREHATKLEVDPSESESDLVSLAVEDDFAGRLYDAPLAGPDAVYVHRGGAYTAEVRDNADEVGAYRVNPSNEDAIRLDNPTTGKAVLATFVGDIADETQAQVAAAADGSRNGQQDGGGENAIRGLATALGAVADAARRAANHAAAGDRARVNESLDTVAARLERAGQRLTEARDGLSAPLADATERRLDQADRRREQAQASKKL